MSCSHPGLSNCVCVCVWVRSSFVYLCHCLFRECHWQLNLFTLRSDLSSMCMLNFPPLHFKHAVCGTVFLKIFGVLHSLLLCVQPDMLQLSL